MSWLVKQQHLKASVDLPNGNAWPCSFHKVILDERKQRRKMIMNDPENVQTHSENINFATGWLSLAPFNFVCTLLLSKTANRINSCNRDCLVQFCSSLLIIFESTLWSVEELLSWKIFLICALSASLYAELDEEMAESSSNESSALKERQDFFHEIT